MTKQAQLLDIRAKIDYVKYHRQYLRHPDKILHLLSLKELYLDPLI